MLISLMEQQTWLISVVIYSVIKLSDNAVTLSWGYAVGKLVIIYLIFTCSNTHVTTSALSSYLYVPNVRGT